MTWCWVLSASQQHFSLQTAEGAAPGGRGYCGEQEIQKSMGVRRRNMKLLLEEWHFRKTNSLGAQRFTMDNFSSGFQHAAPAWLLPPP